MVSKSEIGHFQLGKGPSRGLLRDCEIFVNLNYKLSPSLLSPPVVWPRGENMMKPCMSMNLKSQGLVKHCLQVWTGIGN